MKDESFRINDFLQRDDFFANLQADICGRVDFESAISKVATGFCSGSIEQRTLSKYGGAKQKSTQL